MLCHPQPTHESRAVSTETSFIYIPFENSTNWLKGLKYVNAIKLGVWLFSSSFFCFYFFFFFFWFAFAKSCPLAIRHHFLLFTTSEAKQRFSRSLHAVDYSYQLCGAKKEKVKWDGIVMKEDEIARLEKGNIGRERKWSSGGKRREKYEENMRSVRKENRTEEWDEKRENR